MRKTIVFCLVDLYVVLGDALMPHLEALSPAQLKLLTIYIQRTMQARGACLHACVAGHVLRHGSLTSAAMRRAGASCRAGGQSIGAEAKCARARLSG